MTHTWYGRRIYEGVAALPEKYGAKMGSRVRTSAHILEFLKLYYGRKFCDDLLLDMNIHPCYFDNLENQISFQFITDLIRKLTTLGFSQDHIQSLARLLPIFIQDSPLGSALSKTKSYEELYTRIMENIDRFDKNFIYKTQITEKGVLFEASPSDDLHQAIEQKLTTTGDLKNIFFYRKSLLGAFPILNDSKELKTAPQKALFSGDEVDRYFIEFADQGRHASRPGGAALSLLDRMSD